MVRWRRTRLAEFEGLDSEGLVAARGGRYSAGAMGAEHGQASSLPAPALTGGGGGGGRHLAEHRCLRYVPDTDAVER